MKKIVIVILVVLLVLVGISGWVFAILRQEQLSGELNDSRDKYLIEIQNTEALVSECENEKSTVENILQEAKSEIEKQKQEIQSNNEERNTANEKYIQLSDESRLKDNKISDISTELVIANKYKNTLFCVNRPSEIDYSSNATVSNSLKKWLEDTQGPIEKTEWEVIWSGPDITNHYLHGEFFRAYMVYFHEPEWGIKQGVYDLYGQCFLDLDTSGQGQ